MKNHSFIGSASNASGSVIRPLPSPASLLSRGITCLSGVPIPRFVSRPGYHLLVQGAHTPLRLPPGVSLACPGFPYPVSFPARGIACLGAPHIPRLLLFAGYHLLVRGSHTPLRLPSGVSLACPGRPYPASSPARGITCLSRASIPRFASCASTAIFYICHAHTLYILLCRTLIVYFVSWVERFRA